VADQGVGVKEGFVKFPRTPHLIWLGETPPRNDKLLDAAAAKELLRHPLSVEEKMDGANLGLSLATDRRVRAQSRGAYLKVGTAGQWEPLWRWLAARHRTLAGALGPSLIACGEWCYARHSTYYDRLPDWFLLFDVYDRDVERFWSRERRDSLAREAGLSTVPLLTTGTFGLSDLQKLLGDSRFGAADSEGLYLRWDEGDWLVARAKIVRPGWVMVSDAHWSSWPLKTNRLAADETRESG